MLLNLLPAAVAAALFAAMLGGLELGFRLGRHRARGEEKRDGVRVVDGALFALLGLLIAFTFSGAASRFDQRRELIAREAMAVSTAYLRVDLLSAESQPAVRELFRGYLDTRLAGYAALPDVDAASKKLEEANKLQPRLWSAAVEASRGNAPETQALVLSALNDAFDVTTARTMAVRTHPPVPVFGLLIGLSLACSVLAGGAMSAGGSRHWLHRVGFALIIAVTVYLILELELPRIGFIRVDGADQVLIDVRRAMD